MNINDIINELNIQDYAKDIKLNLQSLVSQSVFDERLTSMLLLAAVYALHNEKLNTIFNEEINLEEQDLFATKAAVSLMAMNNIYYRFLHLSSNEKYRTMPAGLRMNMLRQHGIDQAEFEAMSLIVSIINGCSYCVDAHEKVLLKAGYSEQQVQYIAKLAAVVHALQVV